MVPYSYSPKTGYHNLKVFYDEEEIPRSVNLTVSCGDHLLNTKVEKKSLDIRGFWTGHQYFSTRDCNQEVTFSGGHNAGVVEGIVGQADDKKGTGTFTLTSDETTITFHLEVVAQGKNWGDGA